MYFSINAGVGVMGIPANAKAVSIGLGLSLLGMNRLPDKGMFGGTYKLVKEDGDSAIGKEAAHGSAQLNEEFDEWIS